MPSRVAGMRTHGQRALSQNLNSQDAGRSSPGGNYAKRPLGVRDGNDDYHGNTNSHGSQGRCG
ncbi:hypothetical protein GCM10017707_34210 [Paenarthrobacter aurescens]